MGRSYSFALFLVGSDQPFLVGSDQSDQSDQSENQLS